MAYISIYEFSDYKKFILHWIEQTPNRGRGQRIKLAEAIGCQTPFITHVLSGDYHLSIEQAEACSRWLGLTSDDAEYFMLLVLKQRSSNKSSSDFFQKQINQKKAEHNVLQKRIQIEQVLAPEIQNQYYSHWDYAAVHIALLNPENRTVERLEALLGQSRNRINMILQFLLQAQIIETENKKGSVTKFIVKNPMVHLEKHSPALRQHHTNFRLKAIEQIRETGAEQVHYSGVMSLSKKDFDWVSSQLAQFLEEVGKKLKNSPDEELAVLNFDWFNFKA